MASSDDMTFTRQPLSLTLVSNAIGMSDSFFDIKRILGCLCKTLYALRSESKMWHTLFRIEKVPQLDVDMKQLASLYWGKKSFVEESYSGLSTTVTSLFEESKYRGVMCMFLIKVAGKTGYVKSKYVHKYVYIVSH